MISKTAVGRTDDPRYAHSCELLQNMLPMLSGGAYRRPGTLNVDSILGLDTTTVSPSTFTHTPPRLIPFFANNNELYTILFGSKNSSSSYARAYRPTGNSTGQVTAEDVIGSPPYLPRQTVFFQANSIPDDEIFLIQYAQSADKMWITHPTYKPQVLARNNTDVFTIKAWDVGFTGQDFVNSYPFLNQNATGTTMVPGALTGVTTLTASDFNFNGGIGFVGSTIPGVTNEGMEGSIIAVLQPGAGTAGADIVGTFLITTVNSSTVVTGIVQTPFGTTGTPSKQWWESAWSNYRGWPRSVCFFNQRLVMGGTKHQPDTLWFSETANYLRFSLLGASAPAGFAGGAGDFLVNGVKVTLTAKVIQYPDDSSSGDGQTTGPFGSQPFRITLSQSVLDEIQWLSPDKQLLVGTTSQEWLVSPENGDFSVANSPVVLQSKYGSDYLPAIRIGYELIFPLRQKDEVRAYQYNYIDASFFAEPIQLFFDEYPKPESSAYTPGRRKIRQMDWDVSRQTLWVLDTAGNFYGMTRDRKLNTTMWHTHQFGGFDLTKGSALPSGTFNDPAWSLCDGSVISFAIIPNPISGINDIWLVVKRTIAGIVTWQLERMIGKNVSRTTAYEDVSPGFSSSEPLLVDAAVTTSDHGNPTNLTYSVGAYLNGYSPIGNYYSPTNGIFKIKGSAISGGSTTLSHPLPSEYGSDTNFTMTLGLPFTPIVQPVRSDIGSVIGTSQSAIKRINRLFIRFYKTMTGRAGSPPTSEDLSPLEHIYFHTGQEKLSQSPELFTGDKKVNLPSTYDRDGYIYITCDEPLPFTVVSITMEGEVYD